MQLPPACAGAASSWAPSVPFCAAGPFPERRIATTLSRSPQHFGAGPSDHCAAQRTICSFCATLPSGSRAGPSDHCAAQRAIRPFCATLPSGSRFGGAFAPGQVPRIATLRSACVFRCSFCAALPADAQAGPSDHCTAQRTLFAASSVQYSLQVAALAEPRLSDLTSAALSLLAPHARERGYFEPEPMGWVRASVSLRD